MSSHTTASAERLAKLSAWLPGLSIPGLEALQITTLRPLAESANDAGLGLTCRIEDASGRAYLALELPGAGARYEQAAAALVATGVSVAPVLAREGDLLLTAELSPVRYTHQLNADSATKLHLDAIEALVLLQARGVAADLPEFTREHFLHELRLFPEWYIAKHLGVTLNDIQAAQLYKVFEALAATVMAEAPVAMHGDYQPRNLLVLGSGNPGMLGLQDAAAGPITWDIVSLLRDASVQWDEEMVLDWAIRYWEAAKRAGLAVAPDIDSFYQAFEFTGAARHLMQLGRAARHYHRDGSALLLDDVPTLLAYLQKTCFRYQPLMPLLRLLEQLEDKGPQVGFTF